MILTSDQQLFLRRLDIDHASLALAAQTGVLREFIADRVNDFGASVGYGRKPDGKGVETYQAAMERLWPKPVKVRK